MCIAKLTHATYPELSSALGGAAAVPDLRGQFLRGVGGQSAAIGVKQADAATIKSGAQMNVGLRITGVGSSTSGARSVYTSGGNSIMDISITTPGIEETRPVNVAVRYLIRALP